MFTTKKITVFKTFYVLLMHLQYIKSFKPTEKYLHLKGQ